MSSRTLLLGDALYDYVISMAVPHDSLLQALREETANLPMSGMQISPEQGQLMTFLVGLLGAKKALEVGVFTGYSALCVARALGEDGSMVACDVNESWTGMARRYWQAAGVADRIDLRLAPATETLTELLEVGGDSQFDFAFIDADKQNYHSYYELSLRLIRPGGLIAVDNTLWGGAVIDEADTSADTVAIRSLNQHIKSDTRIVSCLLPIGDGLTLVHKL